MKNWIQEHESVCREGVPCALTSALDTGHGRSSSLERSNYPPLSVLLQRHFLSISLKHLTRRPLLQNISKRQCRSHSDMNWALPAQNGPNIHLGVKAGCNQPHALCVKVGSQQIASGWRAPRQRFTAATAGERFERVGKSSRHVCDGIRYNLVNSCVHRLRSRSS